MRSGICSIQLQALTQEAATLVKQAVNLATRRGHSQVTPLHVATIMLSTSTNLLHKACLQCHSHPFQYKALELCFNVSLNRLPSSTSSSFLGGYQYSTIPSLSNSLVAAFKRAQGHHRCGSLIENQKQQSILALKIEVEQLIISILDDPSVSRVMREAGFSSELVKTNVEQIVSIDHVCSQQPQFHVNNDADDVSSVLSELVRKRRNTVIVGENIENVEEVARGVMKSLKRDNVLQFVSFPIVSFSNIISKEEVERKIVELRRVIRSYDGRGFILYLGDLKWLFEFWSSSCEQRKSYYCSVEHIVMEIKKLISGNGENGKLLLMGIATFETYMKCKLCDSSLETIWELHPFTTTCVGSLSLTLSLDSNFQAKERSKMKFKDESFEDGVKVSQHVILPTWLQNCKDEKVHTMDNQKNAKQWDICKKWNSFCSPCTNLEKPFLHVSSFPSSPTSISSHRKSSSLHLSHSLSWPIICEHKELPKECFNDDSYKGNLIIFMPQNVPKQDLLSNPNSSPNSASSSEELEGLDSTQMLKELNDENMKVLCDAMEKKFPQQKEIAKEIASTVLLCRSGMRKGGEKNYLLKRDGKQETWMLFIGVDFEAKELISKELAKVIFGSYNNFVSIGLSSFSSSKGNEEFKNKRSRGCSSWKILSKLITFLKRVSRKLLKVGSITLPCGESVPLKDAIVIFSCESLCSVSTTSPYDENIGKENVDNLEEKT